MPTLNPGHGPANPRRDPPERKPGSVRRTTTIDMIRPEGFTPGLRLLGLGRDLLTRHDGRPDVFGTAAFDIDVEYPAGRRLLAVRTEPTVPGIAGLVGQNALSGFRRRLGELLPDERTLLRHLLDDVPGATLISGHAQLAELGSHQVPEALVLMQPNVCAGWRDGGTLMNSIDRGDMITVRGPRTPMAAADPLAWHELPPATPTMMRRHRLVDVAAQADGWRVEAYFRDSHWPLNGPDGGRETVIHEYGLTAGVDADLVLRSAEVTPLVLPWDECLFALSSPARLVGRTLAEIDHRLHSQLRGTEACTHLNDVLRSLAGISTMIAPLTR